ncbi:MAG TPA: M48 family metallopeptidase [Capsulimonadaceae bacterium]|nr:M48 family metallopeptidase [Capsulimonadaceae bacterium]
MPHFGYLPPATAAQAASVWALLHVTPRMIHYSRLMDGLAIFGAFYELFLLWLALQTGVSVWVGNLAARWGKRPAFVAMIYWALIGLFFLALNLPFDLYAGFYLPHAYGLSHQTLPDWFSDLFKGWGVDRAVGIFVVAFLLWLIRKTPKRWPYWFAAALAPVVWFGIFLSPLIVDPLFNKFTPLPASNPLYAPLHHLATQAGIPKAEIFVVDKSKQSDELNAYVTGVGSSARIVIWDTLFKKMPADQIEAVTSHEMGHYVEHHIWIGFALAVAGLFISFPIIAWASERLLARFGEGWGLKSLADPAALPLLLLVATFLGYLAGPIENAVSREIEHRADAFGLGLTKNRPAMARAFITLSQEDLDDPYPPAWIKFWLEDHPPLGERIRFALYGQPDSWP